MQCPGTNAGAGAGGKVSTLLEKTPQCAEQPAHLPLPSTRPLQKEAASASRDLFQQEEGGERERERERQGKRDGEKQSFVLPSSMIAYLWHKALTSGQGF